MWQRTVINKYKYICMVWKLPILCLNSPGCLYSLNKHITTANCSTGLEWFIQHSLPLKEQPSVVIVTYRGQDSCTSSDDNLSIILHSSTTWWSWPSRKFIKSLPTCCSSRLLHGKWLTTPQSHRKSSGPEFPKQEHRVRFNSQMSDYETVKLPTAPMRQVLHSKLEVGKSIAQLTN